MSEIKPTSNREEIEREIVRRAKEEENFKKELLDNPTETLEKIGIQVQGEWRVLEETAEVKYIVLPSDSKGDGCCNGYCPGFSVF